LIKTGKSNKRLIYESVFICHCLVVWLIL
jgi:hypothetical protein